MSSFTSETVNFIAHDRSPLHSLHMKTTRLCASEHNVVVIF